MSRDDDWKRISNLAGLDEDGGILPPSGEGEINREPNPWWRNQDWKPTKDGISWADIPEDVRSAALAAARTIDRRYDPPNEIERLGHLVSNEDFAADIIAKAILMIVTGPKRV